MPVIEVGGIKANPGEKAFGFLDVGTTSVNTYRIPVAVLNGAKEGKTLGLLGGTHGTEFASIEAVIRTVQDLDPKKMSGAVLAVTVLNGPHFEHRSAFLSPFDQLNQNRVFPGNATGTLSHRTAHVVFKEVVSRCNALADCHGGDINEDIENMVIAGKGDDEKVNGMALDMARCFPTRHVSQMPARESGLTMSAQKLYRIPCITSEAGTPYPVRERHIRFHYDGIQNVLRYFGIVRGKPALSEVVVNPKTYRFTADQGGIWHSKVEVGQAVDKDQELGNMTDLFGNVLRVYKAPERSVVSMMRVFYSVNCGEALVSVAVI